METSVSVSSSTVAPKVPLAPVTSEKLFVRDYPEILANPPLPNTKLLFSIPVFNEWRNGHFLRNVQALLSQKADKSGPLEVNYVLNVGDNIITDFYKKESGGEVDLTLLEMSNPEAAEKYKDSLQTREFLQKIQYTQRIKLFADKEGRHDLLEELQKEIQAEDPLTRSILKLAVEKADSVAISAIDTSGIDLSSLGYPSGLIAKFRTVGLDYALKRLDSKDAIFLMYDCDTVPATNGFSKEVIDLYEKHPDLAFLFARMGYQVPGINKSLVVDSPDFSLSRSHSYNLGFSGAHIGSPQISFRIKAATTLGDISGDNEDFDTARKLINLFSDSQKKGILSYGELGVVLPVSLTGDRLGSVDGKNRLEEISSMDSEGRIDYVVQEIVEKFALFTRGIEGITDQEEREARLSALQKAREKYTKKQMVQLRMQRETARIFLKAWEDGLITQNETGVQVNQEALLQLPHGKALSHFVNFNKELISELSSQDREYIKYLLGKQATFPNDIVELTPFQKSLREYFGEFVPFESVVQYASLHTTNGELDLEGFRTKEDKRAILPGIVTELYSLGFVSFLHIDERKRLEVKKRDVVSHKPLENRSSWMDKPLQFSSEI